MLASGFAFGSVRAAMKYPLSCAEPLESRIAPAGIIRVTYSYGNLTIVGDANPHTFELASTGGVSAVITPGIDTLIQVGNGTPSTDPLEIANLTGDVRITLGSQDDNVSVGELKNIRNFFLNLGGGSNSVSIGALDIRGSATLLGGKGDDFISLGGSAESELVVGRDFTIKTDQGNSNVSIAALRFEVAGNFRFESGTGNDEFGSAADHFEIGGNASFSLSRGRDLLALTADLGGGIGGRFTVLGSALAGTNTSISVSTFDRFRFGGDVTIATGNSDDNVDFTGGDLIFGGSVRYSGGRGTDEFSINALTASIASNLEMKGGFSLTGQLTIPDGLSIGNDFTFRGGVDSDVLILDAPAFVFGRTSINLGGGLGAAGFGFAGVDLHSNSDIDSVFAGGLDIRFAAGADAESAGGSVSIHQAVLGGPSSIRTGLGGDLIELDRVTVNAAFTITTGGGADSVFWEIDSSGVPGLSTISAPVSIQMGAGDDAIFFGGNALDAQVRFLARTFVSGGAGFDSIDYLTRGNDLTVEPTVRQFEEIV